MGHFHNTSLLLQFPNYAETLDCCIFRRLERLAMNIHHSFLGAMTLKSITTLGLKGLQWNSALVTLHIKNTQHNHTLLLR
jgi:hypothetical protein